MRKKNTILTCSFLFYISFYSFSQKTVLDDSIFNLQRQIIRLKIDSVFGNLDTSKFNSGYLYNRVLLPFAGVQKYDGISDSTITPQNWFQLYFELNEYASYNPALFPHAIILNDSAIQKVNQGVVPLGIINLQYHLIKEQAIDSVWIYLQNQQVYENPSAPVSQYEEKRAFAIAPLIDGKLQSSNNFIIDTSFYFSQKNDSVLFLEIDFGDGAGLRTLNFGEQVSINYSIGGEKLINSRIHFSNGNILHSNSSVQVKESFSSPSKSPPICGPTPGQCDLIGYGNYLAPDDIWSVETTDRYKDLGTMQDFFYDGLHPEFQPGYVWARGRAYIKYGCGNEDKKLRKPFIFVEGINFKNDDNNAEYFGCNNSDNVQYGDVGWPQIITGIDNTEDAHEIEKLKIEKLPNLIKKLCSEGYDLIMLDFQDGDFYMQRNAMVLVELIKLVNNELKNNGSKNQNVILGASMGGQVSRFALKYMESRLAATSDPVWNHNTRLWISYDSPHMGANVPLGMQYAIKWLALYKFTGSNFLVPPALKSPATKQLLLYHHEATSSDGTADQDALRTEIYSDPNMQFPSQLRKIAIANGSGYAVNQGYSAGEQILKLDNNVIQLDIYSVPNDQSATKNTVFHGRLTTLSTITNTTTTIIGWFHFWPFKAITETITETINELVDEHSSDKVKNTKPYDNTSGGQRVSIYTLVRQLQGTGSLGIGSGVVDENTHDYHSFIPAFSALAMSPSVTNITSNLNTLFNTAQGTSSANFPFYNSSLTPFDAVYAPYYNEGHMQITDGTDPYANNTSWIMNETSPFDLYLQNQPLVVNNSPQFNGYNYEARNTITIGNNVTNSIPNGDFVVWGSGTSVDIRAGNEIHLVGGPGNNGVWFKKGSNVHLFIQPFQCNAVCRQGNPDSDNNDGGGRATSSTQNWTDFVYDETNNTEPPPSPLERARVRLSGAYPNPFTDHTHIDYTVSDSGSVNISVYDISGQKIATLVNTNNHSAGKYTATLDARKLTPGIYFCRMETENFSETKKMALLK